MEMTEIADTDVFNKYKRTSYKMCMDISINETPKLETMTQYSQ
jgi:hypothetical protein